MDVREARRALGPERIVGASCYGDLARAHDAAAQGASYLAFGGFYPSLVKKYDFRTDPDLVRTARAELALPLVVIGGMTPERAQPLVERGADLVAAISAVYAAPDIGAAVHGFDALFARQPGDVAKSNST
jgi:thiamine-phosphate pyrophosphorylase